VPPGRRGRPPKFGRPSRLVALTLPDDVLQWLRSIHPDAGWAIVSLFQAARRRTRPAEPPAIQRPPAAELVRLAGQRALIVVDPAAFAGVPGIIVLPLEMGRGFLALEEGRGLADLELAVADSLEDGSPDEDRQRELAVIRRQLREWRKARDLRFTTRSIIVAEPAGPARPRSARRG
jgi:hypothetical protein